MNIYETPPTKIGKHEWRAVVGTHYDGKVYLTYEWRRVYEGSLFANLPANLWRDYHDWPRYDFNDGCHGGMPRSVVKLYRKYHAYPVATHRY